MNVSDQSSLEAFARDPLSANPEQIAELLKAGEDEGTPAVDSEGLPEEEGDTSADSPTAAEDSGKSAKADDPPKDPPADGPKDGAKDGEPEKPGKTVVLAQDGKTVIPYGVLKAAREENAKLVGTITELSTKLAALEEQARTGVKDLSPDVAEIDPETLKDLEENAPSLHKVVTGLMGQVSTLKSQLGEVQAERQTKVALTVQEAIDANPKIAHLQANDIDAFNKIAGFDAILRADPAMAGVPMEVRFGKALAMYESAFGAVPLPDAPPDSSAPTKDAAPDDAEAKAAAALEKAQAKAAPMTLSDIPGGEPPSKGGLDDLATVSGSALTDQLMKMTPEQLNTWMARLP